MNALLGIALAGFSYQTCTHLHVTSGGRLPASHNSRRGYAIALPMDALVYLFGFAVALGAGVGRLGLISIGLGALMHLVYCAFYFLWHDFYSRIHDYRRPRITDDGQMVLPKKLAAALDTGLHAVGVFAVSSLLLKSAPVFVVVGISGGVLLYAELWHRRTHPIASS